MAILKVVRDVCAVVGVELPQSIFAGINGNRTMQEMLALADEMAQRIAYDLRDWTALKTTVTLPGDGVTSAFPLPAAYKRMLLDANVWLSTSTQQPATFISSTDEWLQRRANNSTNAWGEWTMLADGINIWPVMGPGVSARYAFVDRNCVILNAGGFGENFVNDADRFRLDERLLKLGITYQWKAQKGSPYAEDMSTYSDALSMAMGKDQPSPILIDRLPPSAYAKNSYPWQPVPTP